jgi:hypothetical protein
MSLHDVQITLFIAAGIALILLAAVVVVTVLAGIIHGSARDDSAMNERDREGREPHPR